MHPFFKFWKFSKGKMFIHKQGKFRADFFFWMGSIFIFKWFKSLHPGLRFSVCYEMSVVLYLHHTGYFAFTVDSSFTATAREERSITFYQFIQLCLLNRFHGKKIRVFSKTVRFVDYSSLCSRSYWMTHSIAPKNAALALFQEGYTYNSDTKWPAF